MANFGLCVIFVATLVAYTTASEGVVESSLRVYSQPKTVQPELFINRLPLNVTVLSPFQIRYTIGQLQSGDSLKALKSDRAQWSEPQNVQVQLDYTGPAVSFVDITVIQSSAVGNAYVVAGGIGQQQISIVLQGWYTTTFQYTIRVYGR